MRTMLLIVAMPSLALAAGCANAPLQNSEIDGKLVCHPDKVAQAEAQARRGNKQLMWVNCPQAVLRTS